MMKALSGLGDIALVLKVTTELNRSNLNQIELVYIALSFKLGQLTDADE